MSRFFKRPSPAMVIATAALFVALGGVAGALPGTNSVDNGDVKDLKYKNLELKNGWSSSGSGYTPAAALDAQGIVHLRGSIAQGIADGDNFAQLPNALRPDQPVTMPVDLTSTSLGRLSIDTAGEMTVSLKTGAAPTAHKLYTSLDGVSFEAGN
jgi:hypothetical protein